MGWILGMLFLSLLIVNACFALHGIALAVVVSALGTILLAMVGLFIVVYIAALSL